MTLAEAIEHHVKAWGFKSRQRDEHEAAHVILALAYACLERTPVPEAYQGSYWSEVLANTIQDVLDFMPFSDEESKNKFEKYLAPEGFLKSVEWSLKTYTEEDNLGRTMLHILSEKTGKSVPELLRTGGYLGNKPLISQLAELGYTVTCGRKTGPFPHNDVKVMREAIARCGLPSEPDYAEADTWIIEGPDLERPYMSAFGEHMPRHMPAAIKPFVGPSPEEVLRFHAVVSPALVMMRGRMMELTKGNPYTRKDYLFANDWQSRKLYAQLDVREIFKAMPKQDQILKPQLLNTAR
ncbi:MAG: hypothetical protein EBQ96_07900 [Proteobacteria bacterium]|nr:hypothetical protein [Pseudomonadota bacterium]